MGTRLRQHERGSEQAGREAVLGGPIEQRQQATRGLIVRRQDVQQVAARRARLKHCRTCKRPGQPGKTRSN